VARIHDGLANQELKLLSTCRVRSLLRNKSWDARVAAAHAIEAICKNMEKWEPDGGGSADGKVEVGGTHTHF
jgi:hypothetical protein